ncbi:Uncharacterized protein PECH_008968 [Penicillium ucsense]|uniref:Uncharacterized protein n=1 Tax=Penicillium ucsense TaxID=2839758 RepID=A0A8J8WEY4_9EURO|nr:Uncharacterized protein PECM_003143 [Penicillium ucsense]KAF7733755.1 Uncharacterized protein PECH_008968 [Penicillium ucsense]
MSMTTFDQNAAAEVVRQASENSSVRDFVTKFKADNWVNNDWLPLLSAAPLCLEVLGSCVVAANSTKAVGVQLTPPKDGFKKLKGYAYLKTHLVEVHNHGASAFRIARNGMNTIQVTSDNARENVRNVFASLLAAEYNHNDTRIEMESLGVKAKRCKEQAENMERAFSDWMEFVVELHHACTEKSEISSKEYQDSKEEAQAAEQRKKDHEASIEEQNKRIADMEKRVDQDREVYQKALDNFPTADQLFKQTLIHTVVSGVMSAVQVGVGVLASRYNPTSLLNGSSGGDSGGNNTNSLGQANATPAPTNPDFAHNGALRHCRPAVSAVEILYEILGDSKGVDWDRVIGGDTSNAKSKKNEKKSRASGSDASTKPSLQVTRLMLEAIKELINRYPDEKSSESGSTIHNNIVKALGVAEQLSEQGKQVSQLGSSWKKPDASSSIVQSWRTTVDEVLKQLLKLSTQAQTTGAVPPATVLQTSANNSSGSTVDVAANSLRAAQAKLDSAEKALTASQATAEKLKDKAFDIQKDINKVRGRLLELSQQQHNLETVMEILSDCIDYLVDMKIHLRDLIKFFDRVAILVRISMDDKVGQFLLHAGNSDKDRANGDFLSALRIQTLFQYALQSAAYFDFFSEVAALYMNVDTRYIRQGIDKVDKLHNAKGDSVDSLRLQLKEYATDAEHGIKTIVNEHTDKVIGAFEVQIQKIRKSLTIRGVPQLAEDFKSTNQQGKDAAVKEMTLLIENSDQGLGNLTKEPAVRENTRREMLASLSDY